MAAGRMRAGLEMCQLPAYIPSIRSNHRDPQSRVFCILTRHRAGFFMPLSRALQPQ